MRIKSSSQVDGNGNQYIILFEEEPIVDERDLWNGGIVYAIHNDYNKTKAYVYKGHYNHGVLCDKIIATIKDETIEEQEAIQRIKEIAKGRI